MAKLSNNTSSGRMPSLGAVAPDTLLPCRPNVPFLLFHTPKNWFVGEVKDDKGKTKTYWLPKLKPLPLQPGANNIKEGPDGDGPDVMAAQRRIERKLHGTLLHRREQIQVYLREHDCRDPKTRRKGLFWCLTWESPEVIDGQVHVDLDEAAYHRWLLSLVEDGTIRPPHQTVINDYLSRRRGHIPRQAKNAHIPGMALKVKETEAILAREAAAIVPEAAA
jgi:hypothetical protein